MKFREEPTFAATCVVLVVNKYKPRRLGITIVASNKAIPPATLFWAIATILKINATRKRGA